jgi:hypothetical protein
VDILVVSADTLFVSGVEALAGAMGHRVTASATMPQAPRAAVTILDFGTVDPATVSLTGCDPLLTAAFVPASQPGRMAAAQALGIGGVYTRGALPVELPRLLATFGG